MKGDQERLPLVGESPAGMDGGLCVSNRGEESQGTWQE